MTTATTTRRQKFYCLQHTHCGHVAAVSLSRKTIMQLHTRAFGLRFHGWRVRLLGKGTDTKKTCKKCRGEKKALS